MSINGRVPMNPEDYVGWVLGGIAAVVGALATAVTALWKVNESNNSKQITSLTKRADDCEEDRKRLNGEMIDLKTRQDNLETTVKNGNTK